MNTDKELDLLLREWRCDAGADPWLEERVWLRINRAEAEVEAPTWLERLLWLRSPAIACGVLVFAVGAGIGAGELHSRYAEEPAPEVLAERYFESINPIALAAAHQEGRR